MLAEFPSAVEAVRCAIDIQESLRTRNMAYPPRRQMSFRIGITIGDVVERDGESTLCQALEEALTSPCHKVTIRACRHGHPTGAL